MDILDPLDRQLRRKADQLGLSFKDALNRVIQAGLPALDQPLKPYRVRARACGIKPGVDWLHLNRIADELEDERE
ncbi:MAG: hypothetical protein AB1758_00675 [Candidatus Eremiobacterota bacterium]